MAHARMRFLTDDDRGPARADAAGADRPASPTTCRRRSTCWPRPARGSTASAPRRRLPRGARAGGAAQHSARGAARGARPARDVVVGGGHPLSVCSDGTATYLLDDATGERLPGSAERLRTVMRLLDALPQCDYVWPSLSARDLDPLTANLEIELHLAHRVRQAPAGRGARPGVRRAAGRHARGRRRRVARRAADLLGDQLHGRAAAARPRHDRSHLASRAARACRSSSCRCRSWAPRPRPA